VKITFQQTDAVNTSNKSQLDNVVKNTAKGHEMTKAFLAAPAIGSEDRWFGVSKNGRDKKKSLDDIMQNAEHMDAALLQDYRTVLSNTMSSEDYAKMEEEGFDFSGMDPETAVTIVDKIKAELAKAGKEIIGYTDDLDRDTLAAALGSQTLAAAVSDEFRRQDVPMTKENLDDISVAWDMAKELKPLTGDSYRYLIDNEMEPEIWNFYLAQNSGSASTAQPRFLAEDVRGYYVENAAAKLDEVSETEIKRALSREGLEPKAENLQSAEELLREGLPLTKENLLRYQSLQRVQLPVGEKQFAQAALGAIAEGRKPARGRLDVPKELYENNYEKAVRMDTDYHEMELPSELENLSARRLLEEVRLRMSAEVNVKLLESDFAIDTAEIEELVEALRKAEAEVANSYFSKDPEAVPKYQLLRNTWSVVDSFPAMPARMLGPLALESTQALTTLKSFHEQGVALQESLRQAGERYETLMTTPRADLGDSIRKAFANVTDILEDMHIEPTEENQRAVRILGYNRMEITKENIADVVSCDRQVQSVISRMTPAATLQMIRDGVNPLERSFGELEQYFDSRQPSYEEEAESYSRFLYGLEQNKAITEEERSGFIGIYRMLRQIEKTDGAAIGALVNERAKVHFANLLSAVRSGKAKRIDVSVSREFGARMEWIQKGERIDEQIGRAFLQQTREVLTELSYSEEAAKRYREEQLQQIRQAAGVGEEAIAMLQRGELPLHAENMLAAEMLSGLEEQLFARWRAVKAERFVESSVTELLGQMTDRESFQEAHREFLDGVDRDLQEISMQETENSVDVKALQLAHRQLSVAGALSATEEYVFPMFLGQELAKVHLKLEQNQERKGSVDVTVDALAGRLEGHFRIVDGKFTGFLTGNSEDAVMKLEQSVDIIYDYIAEQIGENREMTRLPVIRKSETAGNLYLSPLADREVPSGDNTTQTDHTELYRVARAFLLALEK